MIFEKKMYGKNEIVVGGKGNPETMLFLIKDKEILYIPEYSKEYSFPEDTEVFEVILGERNLDFEKPENMASPFILTGDACFYNFMIRKITVSGEQEFFNKKGKDVLWLLSGEIFIEIPGKEKEKLADIPYVIKEKGLIYKISGNGAAFLLKI